MRFESSAVAICFLVCTVSGILPSQNLQVIFQTGYLGITAYVNWDGSYLSVEAKRNFWIASVSVAKVFIDLSHMNVDCQILVLGCYKYHLDSEFPELISNIFEKDKEAVTHSGHQNYKLSKWIGNKFGVTLQFTANDSGKITSLTVNGISIVLDQKSVASFSQDICTGERRTIKVMKELKKLLSSRDINKQTDL